MAFLKRKEFVLLLRLIVGGVFVYASFDKVQHPHQFAMSVRAYQIVPVAVSGLFALSLAWSELIAGSLMILGVFTRKASAAVALLLVMFIAAVSIVLIKGMVIDCGCFEAEGGSTTGPLLLVRNILLLAGALWVNRFDTGFFGLSRLLATSQKP